MIGKIAASIGAGAVSGLITSVAPGPAPDAAMGPVLHADTPPAQVLTIVVARAKKGDRLISRQHLSGSSYNGVPAPKTVPVGCDPVFSPVTDPAVAHIFKRCMT